MKKMRPITNPMLVGAMELLKAENTPDHRKLVMEEVMHAKFLSPVDIDPKPVPDENGVIKMDPNAKVQLPMLSTPDGSHFFMAYTDMEELRKWKVEENQQIFGFDFKDYVGMLTQEGSVSRGVIVNPFGHNLLIPKEMIDNMLGKGQQQ